MSLEVLFTENRSDDERHVRCDTQDRSIASRLSYMYHNFQTYTMEMQYYKHDSINTFHNHEHNIRLDANN